MPHHAIIALTDKGMITLSVFFHRRPNNAGEKEKEKEPVLFLSSSVLPLYHLRPALAHRLFLFLFLPTIKKQAVEKTVHSHQNTIRSFPGFPGNAGRNEKEPVLVLN